VALYARWPSRDVSGGAARALPARQSTAQHERALRDPRGWCSFADPTRGSL